ncbi:hypothetical protein CQW23_16154 [Capsicum baccatum]|uniref:Knottins-like domain-containing protein n=1 Tax=Capsicum baccatum TaxID=33114 RepID=A0A2G2WAD1_CAPBA|nr:hypothetical protein CQW23_16154 [Capsicum baccatum]
MVRSIYFMAFLVLAMTLFVAHGVQGQNICKTKSKYFQGLCWIDSSCRKVCIEKDNFQDGHCSKLQRNCLCTKLCVFDNIPDDAGTILVQDTKTVEAELLEEEFLKE